MSRHGLSDMLRGLEAGRMQSVGLMQVIPLIGDEFTGYGSPEDLEVETTSYGSLGFQNTGRGKVIIPSGAAYLTKEAAQNHSLPHAGYIPGKRRAKYDDAACIQSSQGGYLPSKKRDLSILPLSLRVAALRVRRTHSYQKLWDSIERLNSKAGLTAHGHLEVFLDHFAKQLDEFAAEFEPVDKQLGAIVLIGGSVVGVERVPNYEHWKAVWRPLIRECYGSHAMMEAQGKKTPQPTRMALPKCRTLAELKAGLDKVNADEKEKTAKVVRGIMAETFDFEMEETTGSHTMSKLTGTTFEGEMISVDGEQVYVSVIATSAKSQKAAFHI
jgi:hypothetical protein